MSWRDVPGWYNWEEIAARRAAEAPDGAVFVEVGVFCGKSLLHLLELLRGKRATVYAIDPWVDDCTEESLANRGKPEGFITWGGEFADECRALGGPFSAFMHHFLANATAEDVEKTRILRAPSDHAILAVEDVWSVWLDGNHNAEAIDRDIRLWRGHVIPGGWIGGHDYGTEYPGVDAAVRRHFGERRAVGENSWEVRL